MGLEPAGWCQVVTAAVQQEGLALQFAAPRLREKQELVLAALEQDWKRLGA